MPPILNFHFHAYFCRLNLFFSLSLYFYFKRWRARARGRPHIRSARRRHWRPQPGGIVLVGPLKSAVHSIVGRQRVNNTRCNALTVLPPKSLCSCGFKHTATHTTTPPPHIRPQSFSLSFHVKLFHRNRQIETVHTTHVFLFLKSAVPVGFDTSFSKSFSKVENNKHQRVKVWIIISYKTLGKKRKLIVVKKRAREKEENTECGCLCLNIFVISLLNTTRANF